MTREKGVSGKKGKGQGVMGKMPFFPPFPLPTQNRGGAVRRRRRARKRVEARQRPGVEKDGRELERA